MREYNGQPILYMPIGPSGCGKTSFYNHLNNLRPNEPMIRIFSFDHLRFEYYSAYAGGFTKDYQDVHMASVMDPNFIPRAKERFWSMIETGGDIYVDNVNLTIENREYFLHLARTYGYWTKVLIFPISMQTLMTRNASRLDKSIPVPVVENQANKIEYPHMGEFDQWAEVHPDNDTIFKIFERDAPLRYLHKDNYI